MRFLAALAMFMPLLSAAQIIIGAADMPSAGDTVRYRTASAAGLDPVPTEGGFVWDFSTLTPDTEGADTCVTVASTPPLYQFFFNNGILYPQHQASYAVRGQSFSFQVLTVANVFEYFKKDATGFRNVGFGANVNGVPTSVRRTPVDWVHRFPLEYGDLDTSYSEFTLTVPTIFSFTQQQTRYNEVDGWGTLYLPADTFEVLRVKSTLARIDSAYIEQFGQGFTFPEPETIEYKWIAQGMDLPVLVITVVGGQPTTARFHYSPVDVTTGVSSASYSYMEIWPNPAEESAWLRLPPGFGPVVELRDATGRLIRTERIAGGQQARIGLAELAQGMYTLTAYGAQGAVSARLMVD
jgi:hypothetical protein